MNMFYIGSSSRTQDIASALALTNHANAQLYISA